MAFGNLFRTFVFIKYLLPLPHSQQWEIQGVCPIADNIGERCKFISKFQNMAFGNLFRTFVFIKYLLPLPHSQQWEIQGVCHIADNIGERCKSISKFQNVVILIVCKFYSC